ncbi:hypothetical protein BOS5A_210504 [Bosea sp. EC-HK365B]|nr:hypothetical protein BOSE7B_120366 [Bosea sp. 7B]VVT59713.1 hypothetical protein BOS5A_210504 [Bosea sp. EC-HK365B]VXC01675.1 hypothetical protein BOSE127_170004 [Bosea sp. 127]
MPYRVAAQIFCASQKYAIIDAYRPDRAMLIRSHPRFGYF